MSEQLPPGQAFTRGKVIARRRKAVRPRLSQAALAKEAGVSRGSVQRAERDAPKQEQGTLDRIVAALKTSLAEIDLECAALNDAIAVRSHVQLEERQKAVPSNAAHQPLAVGERSESDPAGRSGAPSPERREETVEDTFIKQAYDMLGENIELRRKWRTMATKLAADLSGRVTTDLVRPSEPLSPPGNEGPGP